MIQLNNKTKEFALNVPTSFKEITPEYLNKATKHIKIAENYAMIALVLTTKLSEYCYTLNSNSNKQPEVGVTPIIVKFNNSADVHVDFEAGDIAIVANSDLERAYHCNAPSMITSDRVAEYIMSDEQFRKDLQLGNIKDENDKRLGDYHIKMIQFKILPICDIHGSFKPIDSITDEFVIAKPKED